MRTSLARLAAAGLAAAVVTAPPALAQTFTHELIVNDGAFNDLASAAIDAQGNIHIAFMKQLVPPSAGTESLNSQEIFYATNAGGSWAFTRVTDNATRDTEPSIALDANGKVHIAFRSHDNTNIGSGNVWRIRYVNDVAAPFSTGMATLDVTPEATTADGFQEPQIRVDGAGAVHFVFVRLVNLLITNSEIIYTSYNPATGVLAPRVNVSNTPAATDEQPNLDVEADGTVHIVWDRDIVAGSPTVGYATNASGAFQFVPTNLAVAPRYPQVLVGADGRVNILYTVSNILRLARSDAGGVFAALPTVTNLSPANLPAFMDRHALLPDGRLVVAYAANNGVGLRGTFALIEPEGGFETSVPAPIDLTVGAGLAFDSRVNNGTSVAVGPQGQVAIAWSRNNNGVGTIWVSTTDLGGTDCPADFNGDGLVTSADIQAFLNAWFGDRAGGTTSADFNASGATDSADIQAFLNAWFAARAAGGC